jgi:hypothetical protein
MTTRQRAAVLEVPCQPFVPDEAELAAVSFLARYSGRTLDAYRHDLRVVARRSCPSCAHGSTG